MPVCVLGMHDAGTSLVTRLLHYSSLYLGSDDDVMSLHAQNNAVANSWEHLHFSQINNQLLAKLGGSWEHPPEVSRRWWKQPALDALRRRATKLVASFEGYPYWGWTDPSTCLTLPFWLDLVPDLQVVLCLRNPLEVALSMSRSSKPPLVLTDDVLALWQVFHERLLAVMPPEDLLVTHFATYYYDASAELQRVLHALSMEASEACLADAIATIEPRVQDIPYSDRLLSQATLSPENLRTYQHLCAVAGPVYQHMLDDESYHLKQLQENNQRLYVHLVTEADNTVQTLRESEHLRTWLVRPNAELDMLEAPEKPMRVDSLKMLESEKVRLDRLRNALEDKNATLTQTIEQLEEENDTLAQTVEVLADKYAGLEALEGKYAALEDLARHLATERDQYQAQRDYLQRERNWLRSSVWGRMAIQIRRVKQVGLRGVAQKILRRTPQTLYVCLDQPTPGSVLSVPGVLFVSGWGFSTAGDLEQLEVFLDDTLCGTLQYGIHRPDVAATFPQVKAAALSGFERLISLDAIRPGPHKMEVRVTDSAGNTRLITHQMEVVPSTTPRPLLAEQPTVAQPPEATEQPLTLKPSRKEAVSVEAGQQKKTVHVDRAVWREDRVTVEGWFLWPNSQPPRTLHLYHGEHLLASNRHNLSRPEISERFPDELKPYCQGFHLTAPLAQDQIDKKTPFALEITDNSEQRVRREVLLNYEAAPSQYNGNSLNLAFTDFVTDYQARIGAPPSVLDWNTGLQLKRRFPSLAIFSPPSGVRQPRLPYMDQSVDVVFCPSSHPTIVAEAQRVASGAVLMLGSPSPGNQDPPLEIYWQPKTEATDTLPSLSILIPVYNQAHYTRQLIEQLQRTLPDTFYGEVLVIDDGSTDETSEMLAELAGPWPLLSSLRNPENLGFIGSCNRGAEEASGDLLLFLNNDTLPQPGWLLALLDTFQRYPDAGAVGGKLIYPNGTLQEAGAIIFADGSGWNFGRNDPSVDHPLYNHVREVDYCSGAFLATPRALFQELGGFDTRYQPAYYEDVDYCFMVRQKGLKVYYQPKSVIVHFEGISSGKKTTSGVKKYQVVNQQKFADKWREVLQDYPPPPAENNLQIRHRLVVRGALQNERQSYVH